MTTDQYDEQTEAIRRQLKKHRREMWKKREEMLEACKELEAGRKRNASKSHFLPDVGEYQHSAAVANATTKVGSNAVAKARKVVFPSRSGAQPTLTQMLGSSNKQPDTDLSSAHEPMEQITEEHSPEKNTINSSPSSSSDAELADDVSYASVSSHTENQLVDLGEGSSGALNGFASSNGGSSIWNAMLRGKFESSFDAVFTEKEEAPGVEYLLELGWLATDDSTVHQPDDNYCSPSQSSLSTRARSLAADLTGQISADAAKVSAIAAACPNWRENVDYAMRQQDESEVTGAFQKVEDELIALEQEEEQVLRRIRQKRAVLVMYKESLQLSLTRFGVSCPEKGEAGFFLSQKGTPNRVRASSRTMEQRQSLQSEVETIIASAFSPESIAGSQRD
jgi:hypothetical protein